ncbi:MAG TPA: TNT domain-containing protein, partial [Micromonosporaceae bacterium]|nr:TNT domain-containing protein [Micromonosporaceae bacterium]
PGEPPLTLFRGKQLMDLAPGTEIDRFGEPDGNLTFAAGTPFTQRSLVPEWIDRPFHSYRVARPFQVLTGTSIPWFDQAGGGTAYLLPERVEALLADGRLIEVHRHKPPER